MRTKIIAHRGASGSAPENTLAAFRLGLEQGADGVELDVHRTSDGVLVVCHDQRIDRTTDGKGKIADMTLSELRSFSAGAWFGEEFAGEQIPTLEEVLSLYPSGHYVNLEIKNAPHRYVGIERQLGDELRAYGKHLEVVVSSFDHPTLLESLREWPDLERGLLYEGGFIDIWNYVDAAGLRLRRLHPYVDFVTQEYAREAHQRGYGVYTYTVNQEEQMRDMFQIGVDGIITNYPDRARLVANSLLK